MNARRLRQILAGFALVALAGGVLAWSLGAATLAGRLWMAGTVPVIGWLAVAILRDLLAGRLGVDAVALLSMTGALALGEGLAGAVVAVMYSGGNLLEDFAIARAERDLRALVDRAPRIAHRKSGADIEDIPVEDVAVADVLVVRAGEVIPVDGLVLGTRAVIDEAALTGEPLPVVKAGGAPVFSGTLNAGETFELRTTAAAGDSTYAGIVRMVTDARTARAPFIRLADRYALLLLPATLILAGGAWWLSGDEIRALAVLVASTPCPLILAAPVAFIAGVSHAARLGILVKGGSAMEALARTHTVMFDKTGTLTVGGARLVAVETAPGVAPDTVLRLAASLEQASHHVVADAIVGAAHARGLELELPEDAREAPGSGLEGRVGGQRVQAGSYDLVCGRLQPAPWTVRALRRAAWRSALSVFVAVDGELKGAILLADELRRETPRAVQSLRAAGVQRIVMLTGDNAAVAETIGAALDLDSVLANRSPADKLEAVIVEQRLAPTLMVGDGINDAPALAAADVGIAMGAHGATASSEAADVVILVDQLDRVSDAVAIARRTRRIALQSIGVGMGLSGLAMVAAALGWLAPVAGALTQEAIDVAVILNALRALSSGRGFRHGGGLQRSAVIALQQDHLRLEATLDRMREIADGLDDATGADALALIREASQLVTTKIVTHERGDETTLFPRLRAARHDDAGLAAMSRAHREILHLARLLEHLAAGLTQAETDRYLIRDAQRMIEAIEALARMHNAQEEDIYEHAAA
ncbi:heavy metal translocating P-type ATPase [Xanthobacter sp. V4C-4]|uniref:heavy metal translocating P-type ATPase n=1 Tax=Xanthobacter cornucopiae TaxID=3119924 RepID=UPI00372935DC